MLLCLFRCTDCGWVLLSTSSWFQPQWTEGWYSFSKSSVEIENSVVTQSNVIRTRRILFMSDMHGYNTTNAWHSALHLLEKFYKPGQLERKIPWMTLFILHLFSKTSLYPFLFFFHSLSFLCSHISQSNLLSLGVYLKLCFYSFKICWVHSGF